MRGRGRSHNTRSNGNYRPLGAGRSESAESWSERFPELEMEVIKRLMKKNSFANDARLSEIMSKEAEAVEFNALDDPPQVQEQVRASQEHNQGHAAWPAPSSPAISSFSVASPEYRTQPAVTVS
jgi:hypothetical protein